MKGALSILIILCLTFSCKKADPKADLEVLNLKDISSQPIVPYTTSSKTIIASTSATINDIANTNSNLYLAGNFSSLGAANSRCIAVYEGSSISSFATDLASGSTIKTLNYYQGKFVIGGLYTTTANSTT